MRWGSTREMSSAAPNQELPRKLVYLAEIGSALALSGHVAPHSDRATGCDEDGADGFSEVNQILA